MEQRDNEPKSRTNPSRPRHVQHEGTGEPEWQQSDRGPLRRPEELMTPTGPGYLGTRLGSTSSRGENGLIGPDLEVQDVDGQRRTINEGDYRSSGRLPVVRSETGESEGASSIISVPDYGFAAAHEFLPSPPDPNEKAMHDRIMDSRELQNHLGLEFIEGRTVAEVISAKIEQQLCSSMMNRNPAGKQPDYLPIDQLYRILDINCISSLVKERCPTAISKDFWSQVAHITGGSEGAPTVKGRWRILAILIWSDHLDGLESFIRDGIRDEDLPLERCSQRSSDCVTRTRPNETNRTLFRGWGRNQLTLFFEYQHIFHVPFFDLREDRLCSYEFSPKARLPWLSFEYVTSGGSGTVYRIQIDPSHHNYRTYSRDPQNFQQPVFFALKKINSLENEAYKKEITAHEKTCAKLQKGGHIIKLLLTLEHGGDHYLLFEWADGDLDQFWQRRTVTTSAGAEKWAARQCFGLASALKQIHGQATWQRAKRSNGALSPGTDVNVLDDAEYGRHGDIKPQNILWFSRYGRQKDHMVISDLGLTRYHTSLTRSRVTSSKIDGYSKAYRAPEMDLDNPVISRKFDVWSLGCVFLEFCTWYLEGMGGIARFDEERAEEEGWKSGKLKDTKFFITKRAGDGAKVAEVKTAVTNATLIQWLDRLTHQYSGNVFARHILDTVRTKMLVVEVKDRKEMDIICIELLGIIKALGDDVNETQVQSPLPSPTMPAPTLKLEEAIYSNSDQELNKLEPADLSNIATGELDLDVYDKINSGGVVPSDRDDGYLFTATSPATQASLTDRYVSGRPDDNLPHLPVEAITIGSPETTGKTTQNIQAKVDSWMEYGGGEGPTAPHSSTTSHRSPSLVQEPVDLRHFPRDSASIRSRVPPSISVNEPEILPECQAAAAVDVEPAVLLQPHSEPTRILQSDGLSSLRVTDTGLPVVISVPGDTTTTPALTTCGIGVESLATDAQGTESLDRVVEAQGGRFKKAYNRLRGAVKNAQTKFRFKMAREKGSTARGL